MLVGSLMTPSPRTVAPEASLDAAARWLWELDVGVLPVVRGDRPVGMLTDRDVCMAAYTQGRPLRELTVAQAMSRELHAACLEDDAVEALRLMAERQVRRLPVVDEGGALVGLLSLADLEAEVEAGRLDPGALAGALAAIARPRRPVLRPLVLEPTSALAGPQGDGDGAAGDGALRRASLRTRIMARIVPTRAPR